MPDTTPISTQKDTAPAEDGWRPDLSVLRARLDGIDDRIHDLLMERARVVEGVARSGKPAAFRPGREASMLRRLLGRHEGALPARTVVRMWREMLAGTTAMQAPIRVAVMDSVAALAREHFGFLTPMMEHASAGAALDAVRAGTAAVAVLPFAADWWAGLIASPTRMYIVARLPFWADRPDGVPSGDALAIATTPPDASGSDRSLLLVPAPTSAEKLAAAGLTLTARYGKIVEVEGLIEDNDPRLPANTAVLGGYAVPVAGARS